MFKWTYGLLGHNYRAAALSTLYCIRNHNTKFEIDRKILGQT